MAALAEAGLAPADAKLILSYQDPAPYIEAALRERQLERLERNLDIVTAFRAAQSREGYQRYTAHLQRALVELRREDGSGELTVFERMKREKRTGETLFERMKREKKR